MKLLIIVLFVNSIAAFGQKCNGVILSASDKSPIEFASIGVVGKNVGTTSNEFGVYSLNIDSKFDNDTLKVSNIGYEQFSIKVSDFKKLVNKNIELKEKYYKVADVVVVPKIFKQKTIGYTSESKTFAGGFNKVNLGCELGILLNIKKSAILEKLNLNVISCSYDTIFYRINLYKVENKMPVENILDKPIYVKIPKELVKDKISIDLIPHNLHVNGDCIITLECVKDLGPGALYFSETLLGTTYYKETSQGTWQTMPAGVSFNVEAKVEK